MIPFARAPFDQLAHLDVLRSNLDADGWPTLANLSAALPPEFQDFAFIAQDAELLREDVHYEVRIAQQQRIATRLNSLHDLYSACTWLRFAHCKRAVNALQMQGIDAHGTKTRSRHQQSITHLDEAGVWLACSDPALIALVDAHDWHALFCTHAQAWGRSIEAQVFGHGLFEMMHDPHLTVAAKTVWVLVPDAFFALPRAQRDALIDQRVARALLDHSVAGDPKLLSTIPICGIPGWHAQQDADFYASAPCFRSKPPGRSYSPMIAL